MSFAREDLVTDKGLNHELTRFYLESGRVFTPDDWLGRNPYHEAFFDHLEEWMER